MNQRVSLTLTADQHTALLKHLFPDDGLEAVAFIACGRARGDERHRLLARYLHPIPHENCTREPDRITWHAEDIELLLDQAEVDGLSLIKVHSHPGGHPFFSPIDDESDAELLPTIRSWAEGDFPHGSVIMLPDGRMFGRYLWHGDDLQEFELINVVGPDLTFWWTHEDSAADPAFAASQDQAFGEGTTRRFKRLRIGVIGGSGTGRPPIEQLVRLGVGEIVPVDDDFIEDRNLNRIIFATQQHADVKMDKVAACKEDIDRKGLGTRVIPIAKEVGNPEALRALSQCDIIFGCVDTVSGRFIANLLCSHYIIPFVDIGILLDAEQDGAQRGRIRDILGTVNYVLPGKSSLLSRECFSLADVAAEDLHKRDPKAAAQQVQDKYIKGMNVRRPAVVSVNMLASSLAVNDLLARLHPYRRKPNSEIASIEFSLAEIRLTDDEEWGDCPVMSPYVGFGDRKLWLGLPQLGEL